MHCRGQLTISRLYRLGPQHRNPLLYLSSSALADERVLGMVY